jgi:hypothetical protein
MTINNVYSSASNIASNTPIVNGNCNNTSVVDSVSNIIKPLTNFIVGLRNNCTDRLFTVLNHNENSNSSKSLALYEYTQALELLALAFLANPKGVAIGILTGTISLLHIKSVLSLICNFHSVKKTHQIAKQTLNEENDPDYNLEDYKNDLVETKESMMDIRTSTRIGPILEEFIFRVVIQKTTEWIASKVLKQILPKDETTKYGFTFGPDGIKCKGYNINIPKIIAIFISSVTFALGHYTKSPEARLRLLPRAVIDGILADRYGILSSVSSHIMNNLILDIEITHTSGVLNLLKKVPKNPSLEEQKDWLTLVKQVTRHADHFS